MVKNRSAEVAFNKKEINPDLLYIENKDNKYYILVIGKTPRGKYPQGFRVTYSMTKEQAKKIVREYTEEYFQNNNK